MHNLHELETLVKGLVLSQIYFEGKR